MRKLFIILLSFIIVPLLMTSCSGKISSEKTTAKQKSSTTEKTNISESEAIKKAKSAIKIDLEKYNYKELEYATIETEEYDRGYSTGWNVEIWGNFISYDSYGMINGRYKFYYELDAKSGAIIATINNRSVQKT